MKLKRGLYLCHRWLGVGMSLFLTMWFFSGVVMMYVGFPSLTEAERLHALPVLKASEVNFNPNRLRAGLKEGDVIRSLRLTSIAGRPVYLLETIGGTRLQQYADNGAIVSAITESEALATAQAFLSSRSQSQQNASVDIAGTGGGSQAVLAAKQIEMDQWTVSSSLHAHRPLYQIPLDDAAGTELYVSSVTGEVVRDSTRSERTWNWLGANLHWIYPLQLRRHQQLWYWVIVILSLIGLVSILTGSIIGIQRLRIRKRYRGKDVTPYRGYMKWHHLLGLVSSAFLFTFMFSGLMSMSPWGLFESRQNFEDLVQSYRQPAIGVTNPVNFLRLQQKIADLGSVKEIRWQWLEGREYQVLVSAPYDYRTLLPVGWSEKGSMSELARQTLIRVMADYAPTVSKTDQETLAAYDLYYYSHHQNWRPLPVVRIQFNDSDQSWFYIDPRTGELIGQQTQKDRLQRWLFNGLHSLDFNVLIQHRPLWDGVVIFLCILGFAMSVTSVVIGCRRLAN
ncbi:PepSY domain-containing protein [Ketobacter sp.]